MRMKKALIITGSVILVLVLLLTGLFFWKGGHHAIALAEILEDWLDDDIADQSLTLMLMKPDVAVDDRGQVKPVIRQFSLNADTFWTEYADQTLFGLTAQDMTAYTDGKILYMDTGNAYTLPESPELEETLRELALGLLVYGRVTKNDDTYRITMESEKLDLDITITADKIVHGVTVQAVLPDDTAAHVTLNTKDPMLHTIPTEVTEAMVRAQIEPPMLLTEPLDLLLPALETLLPLTGDLTLGIECGILNLSETVILRVDEEKAELERKGKIITIDLPSGGTDMASTIDPAALGLLLLHSGEFTAEGDNTLIQLGIPGDVTGELCAALVPQAADLGIEFATCHVGITFQDSKLISVSLSALGEVPFLMTTIPVSFYATLELP